jgi:hypothetical protein
VETASLSSPCAAEDAPAPVAPLVSRVAQIVLDRLVADGQMAATLGAPPPASGLQLLGACHDTKCGKLLPRRQLKRCSACKVMMYCSAACQARHWNQGGHKRGCKDIQAMNALWDTGPRVLSDGDV